jgi:hypothetical protein
MVRGPPKTPHSLDEPAVAVTEIWADEWQEAMGVRAELC